MMILLPLLPHPALSRAADLLLMQDRTVQLTLALDAYDHLRRHDRAIWRPAAMWEGCDGALLFWAGELARGLPRGPMDAPRLLAAWGDRYRASEMAVGPLPWWLGNRRFHLHCQSQLIAEDHRYASQFVHAPLNLMYLMPLEENTWQTV